MKISKSHDAFIKVKDILKTNKYKELSATDDLQVLELINKHNIEIEILLYSYEENYHDDTKKLLDELIKKANEVYEISNAAYSSIALKENHAGIIAAIKLPNYSFNDFKKKEYLFVLDKLEIPGNIGTIYRTLDSINCEGVILVDAISKPNNPKLVSASRGTSLTIPTICASYNDTLSFLLENNYDIYLGEPELGLDYQSYDYKGKIAFVVGNERFGINSDWYNHKNKKVFIPMEGSQNSLNVGVAASILAYEAYMKRK